MIRYSLILAAAFAAALTLTANCASAKSIPANIASAVADSNRPDADKQRDANRKPAESLAFAGVKPGAQVAEFFPAGGYFTRILSKAVGSAGHVYALVPERPADAPADMADFAAKVKAIAADPNYCQCHRHGTADGQTGGPGSRSIWCGPRSTIMTCTILRGSTRRRSTS